MLFQEEVLNWALPSHGIFESRCGKETPLFRHQICIYAITKHFSIIKSVVLNCDPWAEKVKKKKKLRLMHMYQQLPSLEWKLPKCLRRELSPRKPFKSIEAKIFLLSKDKGFLVTCKKTVFRAEKLSTHINFCLASGL